MEARVLDFVKDQGVVSMEVISGLSTAISETCGRVRIE